MILKALLSILLFSFAFGFMDLVIWKEIIIGLCFVIGANIMNGGDKL